MPVCRQVKHSAANFNAEELPLATSIFKGIDYTRQKGPPESLRVRTNSCKADVTLLISGHCGLRHQAHVREGTLG